MNTTNSPILVLSVHQLFGSGTYDIPLYQRNYAWGEAEIEQLLRDVMDMASADGGSRDYHIGTLVVSCRSRDKQCFETIDGQQRHTTLALLLAVLKHKWNANLQEIKGINLRFDGRPRSEATLHRLFQSPEQIPSEEAALRRGYEIAHHFLHAHFDRHQSKLAKEQFTEYLLRQVKLLRVEVPEETDLNHYFEVMNNRGEQLEKHEILKASLMKKLGEQERIAFAKVWDACADMSRHVQLGFAANIRDLLFGKELDTPPATPEILFSALNEDACSPERMSLLEIIDKRESRKRDSSRNEPESGERGSHTSIINFSNFLLQTLRVLKRHQTSLDDKQLLNTFEQNQPDPRKFITQLLKCRFLLDYYVVKQDSSEEWKLERLKRYDSGFGYVNTFGDEGEDDRGKLNRQLSMLLSMFHVSFPAQAYKHWLAGVLLYLNGQERVDGPAYLGFLERLSDRFLFGRLCERPFDYEELLPDAQLLAYELNESILHAGTQVPNFVFNRLDYLLWKRIEACKGSKEDGEFQDAGVDMGYVEARHKKFRFSFRSSVEHYYPQHPSPDVKLNKDKLKHGVDSFANLCLISHSQNSRLSNLLPQAKKEHCDARYHAGHFTESLKQVLMMSHKGWGPGHEEEMLRHGEMMIRILMERGQA